MNLYGWKDAGAKRQCPAEVTNEVLDDVYDPLTSKPEDVFFWGTGDVKLGLLSSL